MGLSENNSPFGEPEAAVGPCLGQSAPVLPERPLQLAEEICRPLIAPGQHVVHVCGNQPKQSDVTPSP